MSRVIFWWTVAILLIVVVYVGIPLGAWLLLHPTVFWEKLALVICTFIYEGAALAWGIVFGIGILAAIAD